MTVCFMSVSPCVPPPIPQVLCCGRGRTTRWIQSMLLQWNPGFATYFPEQVTAFAPLASVRSTSLTCSLLKEKEGPRATGAWNSACHAALHSKALFGISTQCCKAAGRRAPHCGGWSCRPHTVGRKAAPSCHWQGEGWGRTAMTSLGCIPGCDD